MYVENAAGFTAYNAYFKSCEVFLYSRLTSLQERDKREEPSVNNNLALLFY